MTKINHYGVQVNSESPITGVISSNEPDWLYDEAVKGNDVGFEEHLKKCKNQEHDECYNDDEPTYLIGFKKNTEGKYEPDPKAEYSAIVQSQYTQIIKSRYISRCALCSPCFPGQGDLETPGEFMTYTLPPEIWGVSILEIMKLDQNKEFEAAMPELAREMRFGG